MRDKWGKSGQRRECSVATNDTEYIFVISTPGNISRNLEQKNLGRGWFLNVGLPLAFGGQRFTFF